MPKEAPETPRAQLIGDELFQQKLVAFWGPFPEVSSLYQELVGSGPTLPPRAIS